MSFSLRIHGQDARATSLCKISKYLSLGDVQNIHFVRGS